MKKLFFAGFVLLFATTILADDLVEAAKREKERREALKKQGKKAKVLTNQDIKNIKSSLGIESETPVEEPATSETSTEPTEPEAAVEQATGQSNAELEQLKQQREQLQQELKTISDSIEQSGARASNIGQQYREKRLKEEELRKLEQKIEELGTASQTPEKKN